VTKNARFITAYAAAVLATLLAVTACRPPSGQTASRDQPAAGRARQLRAEVVQSFPHDPAAFTQGLVLAGGVLYESTGLEGRSSVRRVEPATGRVLASVDVPRPIFGEGLAAVPGALIQLTWTSETALVYDQQTLALLRRVPYQGEGWGLCYDGTSLVMSDGSAALTYRRPDSLAVDKTVTVTLDGVPQRNLNELECVEGSVYANVWHRDFIVRVDPASGRVSDRIDASGLLSGRDRDGADVLNGIAYDPADGLFYLTGKLWPRLFKVRFVPAPGAAP
jgi:glutaminyl-peptide cyclotransferase